MTTSSWAHRLLPAALRPVTPDQVPAGWEQRAYDPAVVDLDALTWLGFEPGDEAEPLLSWAAPDRWPARRTDRRRASARLRIA